MEADYPAAHSMDTTWFAVDRDGHVGLFSSSEDGAVPEGVDQDSGFSALLNLLEGAGVEHNFDMNRILEEAARLGLFCYEYDEFSEFPLQAGYPLQRRPSTPLHIDSLPPALRNLSKEIRLDRIRFPDAERVQPLEHLACQFWGEEEVAYLAADGVTVRPIPGREGRFAAFRDELRRDFPEAAARLRFEAAAENQDPRREPHAGG